LAARPRHDGPRSGRDPEDRPLALNKDDRKAVILGHPLWRRDEEHLTDWQRHVRDTVTASTGVHAVELSDLYEMDRQPLAVLRHLT
jgi:DEAD/DEAH box helicase domain-containing protein